MEVGEYHNLARHIYRLVCLLKGYPTLLVIIHNFSVAPSSYVTISRGYPTELESNTVQGSGVSCRIFFCTFLSSMTWDGCVVCVFVPKPEEIGYMNMCWRNILPFYGCLFFFWWRLFFLCRLLYVAFICILFLMHFGVAVSPRRA